MNFCIRILSFLFHSYVLQALRVSRTPGRCVTILIFYTLWSEGCNKSHLMLIVAWLAGCAKRSFGFDELAHRHFGSWKLPRHPLPWSVASMQAKLFSPPRSLHMFPIPGFVILSTLSTSSRAFLHKRTAS